MKASLKRRLIATGVFLVLGILFVAFIQWGPIVVDFICFLLSKLILWAVGGAILLGALIALFLAVLTEKQYTKFDTWLSSRQYNDD